MMIIVFLAAVIVGMVFFVLPNKSISLVCYAFISALCLYDSYFELYKNWYTVKWGVFDLVTGLVYLALASHRYRFDDKWFIKSVI